MYLLSSFFPSFHLPSRMIVKTVNFCIPALLVFFNFIQNSQMFSFPYFCYGLWWLFGLFIAESASIIGCGCVYLYMFQPATRTLMVACIPPHMSPRNFISFCKFDKLKTAYLSLSNRTRQEEANSLSQYLHPLAIRHGKLTMSANTCENVIIRSSASTGRAATKFDMYTSA